jgi:hypothetical protein
MAADSELASIRREAMSRLGWKGWMEGGKVEVKWLRGHKGAVADLAAFNLGEISLDDIERVLKTLPGVYETRQIPYDGRLGLERDLRPQVRALMQVAGSARPSWRPTPADDAPRRAECLDCGEKFTATHGSDVVFCEDCLDKRPPETPAVTDGLIRETLAKGPDEALRALGAGEFSLDDVRGAVERAARAEVPPGLRAAGDAYFALSREDRRVFVAWLMSRPGSFTWDGEEDDQTGLVTSPVTRLCACGCGEPVTSPRPEAKYATGACRVRAHRERSQPEARRQP